MESPHIEVPAQLFAPAESLSFAGTYNLPELVQGADTYTFEHPLTWEVTISNTGGALLVTGIVTADAITSCVRCLEPAEYRLEGEVEGYYLIPDSDVELTEEEKEEYELLGEDHIIDLSPLLVAALSLELPHTPLCDDECKGLCAAPTSTLKSARAKKRKRRKMNSIQIRFLYCAILSSKNRFCNSKGLSLDSNKFLC